MLLFDASVDLTRHSVPRGMAPAVAVERTREALGALAGAGWVSVEWCGEAPTDADWVRVYKPGATESLPIPAGDAVLALLKITVRKALFPGPTSIQPPDSERAGEGKSSELSSRERVLNPADSMILTPKQCREAREKLRIGVRALAKLSGILTVAIKRVEAGEPMLDFTLSHFRAALEAAGVEFIAENGGRASVQLRNRPSGPLSPTEAEEVR